MNFLPGWGMMMAAPAAEEAFPVVETTNQGGTTALSLQTTFAVPLPSGIQAGNLLIAIVSLRANNGRNISAPSGWDTLFHVQRTGSSGTQMLRLHAAFYRVADGSEGATVSMSTNSDSVWTTNSYRISGAQGTPEADTAMGDSSSPNPPSLSPSWGSAKTLWIATEGDQVQSGTTPSLPSNYTDQVIYRHINSGTVFSTTSSGRRELEAASEDPGTFSLGGSDQWTASTIAIQPT